MPHPAPAIAICHARWSFSCFSQLGNDEATEGGIELFLGGGGGVLAEETTVGAVEVLVREGFIVGVPGLPIGETGRVGEFRFGSFGALAKRRKSGALVGGELLLVFVQGIITNDRLSVTVGDIKLAVAGEAALQFG